MHMQYPVDRSSWNTTQLCTNVFHTDLLDEKWLLRNKNQYFFSTFGHFTFLQECWLIVPSSDTNLDINKSFTEWPLDGACETGSDFC